MFFLDFDFGSCKFWVVGIVGVYGIDDFVFVKNEWIGVKVKVFFYIVDGI